MTAEPTEKLNCWDYLKCDRGPTASEPCPVATDRPSDGVNSGTNGGRFCWAVAGSLAGKPELAPCARDTHCLDCEFFNLVKSEEGQAFHLFKLAMGVASPAQLQRTISQVESLMTVHERLRSHFDLSDTIREVTRQAREVTRAHRCIVLLLKGDPPALHGEFMLREKPTKVVIQVDEILKGKSYFDFPRKG